MSLKEIDGLPIMNAKKAIKLHITHDDISGASRKTPSRCVVAIACTRLVHAREVRVHLGRVYVRTNESNWQRYVTPKNMRQEIIAFDRGGSFEPGDFTLVPVAPSKQIGGHLGGKSTNAPVRRKRRPAQIVKNVRTGPA